jgi:hypothetical protein
MTRLRSRWLLAGWVALAVGRPAGAAAQDTLVIRPSVDADSALAGSLPPEVVREAIAVFNDSTTTRFTGSITLPANARLAGRIAVFRGNLRVHGRIEGEVTVINGDLIVASGGVVAGDVLVPGGRIEVRPGGTLAGERRSHEGFASVYRTASGLLAVREPRKPLGELAAARASFTTGRILTTLSLETGRTYNRVEGLPIVFGPTFTVIGQSTADARVDLRGIFRPATDRTKLRDNLGFQVTAELGGGKERRWISVGGRGYRRIQSIEDQPLGTGESGWSAFLLQRDYRDHFEARGIEGYATVEPVPRLRLGVSLRRDHERSVRASDPLSVFRNSESWRPNPLIDDGHYRTERLSLDWDSRNDPRRPASGWHIHARVERSRSDDVSPVALPGDIRGPIPSGRYAFSTLWFDVRRYARVNPGSRVGLRLLGGGWLGGDPLPVQRRVSLGGPDLLPGFGFRDLNCAPAGFIDQAGASVCDRMLAVQLEVRTDLSLRLPFRIRNPDLAAIQQVLGVEQADLVLLANAGKAWLSGDGPGRVPNNRIPALREWDADVGLGIDAGGLGVYVTRALTADQPFRVVVRLQQRF